MADVNVQSSSVEKAEDFGKDDPAIVQRWLAEIKAYDKEFSKWRERASKVVRRYRDEPMEENTETSALDERAKRFNIFWSNVQTLGPALFSRIPRAVAQRRNKDQDDISTAASEILERSLQWTLEEGGFAETIKAARDDYLIPGRGQAWVRYEPVYGPEQPGPDIAVHQEGEQWFGDDGQPMEIKDQNAIKTQADGVSTIPGEPFCPVVEEILHFDYIPWQDFGHTPAPRWDLVTAVWRRDLLTRDQLEKRFGEKKSTATTLTKLAPNMDEDIATKFGDVFKRAEVYQIWDKNARKAIWISPGYLEGPLDILEDPLKLRDFFPCPKPLYATMTTNTLVPVPDYTEYQAQALELDLLTQRIDRLAAAMRVVGAYDSSFPALEKILKGSDNDLIPVDQWAMFAERGGLQGVISFLPIKEVAETLKLLIEVRNQIKQDLYEITGLSDLVRGQNQASATATAERIKGRFVTLRLQDRQDELARFCRDLLRIAGEILSEHFSDQSLIEISGWMSSPNAKAAGAQLPQLLQAAFALLRDDCRRTFKIDVETDTTILEDVELEKSMRVEFLQAVSGYLQNAMPAIESYPALGPLLAEMLMFGVRAFSKGQNLEMVFERAIQELSKQPPQPRDQDPDGKKQKAALEAQRHQDVHGLEVQKFQHQQKKDEADSQRAQSEEGQKLQQQLIELQNMQLQLEIQLAEIKERTVDRERSFQIEIDKLNDTRQARREEHSNELEYRRLDGKMVPTMEEDVKDVANALTELADAILKMMQQQQASQQALLGALTAPRKIVRDESGKIVGSETEQAQQTVQ